MIIRGAPEAIESSCAELDQKVKDEIRDWTGWEGRRGHRVLAVGYKEINTNDTGGDFYARALAENDFIFSGIISFVELLYYRSKLSNSL
ncbi:MAG: hypothetical protein L6Q97_17315 [Thermoanaerobaculia bacterium]|nr:hypothetical protein [Thermoanaerobaculia bacterium]